MKILIVDDSTLQRMMLTKIFGAAGHSVLEAADGHDAIAKLRESPDVIVCDILMPGLDGFGLLEVLNAQRSPIPVVIASADFHSSVQAKCCELGAFAFVRKPYCGEELRAVVTLAHQALEALGASSTTH